MNKNNVPILVFNGMVYLYVIYFDKFKYYFIYIFDSVLNLNGQDE